MSGKDYDGGDYKEDEHDPDNEGQYDLPEGFTAVFSMHKGVALRDQIHYLNVYRDLIVA
jgi:hypothetical protein